MGDYSYSQGNQDAFGHESYDYSGGGYDGGFGGGYQDEVAALVPEGTPMLAAILMEQRVFDAEGLHRALARQMETGDSLCQVLMDEGLAAPDQLLNALQSRAHYR